MNLSRNNGAEAELTLRYFNGETTKAIAEAVSPDNFKAPEGLTLTVLHQNTEIYLRIHCPKGLGSLISTLDDLLSCISAAEKTINSLE